MTFGKNLLAGLANSLWSALLGLAVTLGVLTLAALIGALAWAWRTGNRPALWLAYTGFSIEILALYAKKLGTLMGTSAFFLVTGLMVIALSALAYRLHTSALKPDALKTGEARS